MPTRCLVSLWRWLNLPCREFARLTSEALDRPLSQPEVVEAFAKVCKKNGEIRSHPRDPPDYTFEDQLLANAPVLVPAKV